MDAKKLLLLVPAIGMIAVPEPVTTVAGTVIVASLTYDALRSPPRRGRRK